VESHVQRDRLAVSHEHLILDLLDNLEEEFRERSGEAQVQQADDEIAAEARQALPKAIVAIPPAGEEHDRAHDRRQPPQPPQACRSVAAERRPSSRDRSR